MNNYEDYTLDRNLSKGNNFDVSQIARFAFINKQQVISDYLLYLDISKELQFYFSNAMIRVPLLYFFEMKFLIQVSSWTII